MAKGIDLGAAGVKIVKQVLGGVGGVKKIKEVYGGVNGVKLLWSASVPAGQKIFTSSQTWVVPSGITKVDVFLVGGGAGGRGSTYDVANGGGGSGYTKTFKGVVVVPGASKVIVIGAGGTGISNPGGLSSFESLQALGGPRNTGVNSKAYSAGGAGGSGGGGGKGSASGSSTAAAGGSDGANGNFSDATRGPGGVGQGTTTRAFEEAGNTLYAGGGGGGAPSSAVTVAPGGAGGGGAGGKGTSDSSASQSLVNGKNGTPNTGGGGGGQGYYSRYDGDTAYPFMGGTGGSGLIIVRWAEQ